MKQLTAIHEIVRDAANGGRETIAPGKRFAGSDADAEYLVKIGAAKLVETSAAPAPVAAAPAQSTQALGGTGAHPRDLSKLKKPELLDIAQGLEIEGADGMTAAQLIEAIQAEETELAAGSASDSVI